MFAHDDILDFVNKIISQVEDSTDEEIENNLRQFRNYLELTQMVDGETLKRIDDILDCVEYLIALRDKLGYVDVKAIVPADKDKPKTLKKKNIPKRVKKSLEEKHYHHYSSIFSDTCGGTPTPSRSSMCGGSSPSYSSSCGSSGPSYYSSGCGGGGSYRSGC